MIDSELFEMPTVHPMNYDTNFDEMIVSGALGCFEEESSYKLMNDLKLLAQDVRNKKMDGVLSRSAGMGHGSVLDQAYFVYSIENLPRAATLQLCQPEFLAHEQQSLRRAKATRGFYIPPKIVESKLFKETKSILSDSFALYEKMASEGVPGEDARYILPLYTKTNIQTAGDIRELQHLHAMNEQGEVPSIVQETVNRMVDEGKKWAPTAFQNRGKNYEMLAWRPSAQIYAKENYTINKLIRKNGIPDNPCLVSNTKFMMNESAIQKAIKWRDEAELSNFKHIHFNFLVPMSYASFHQSIRQRTWNHSVESIYDSATWGFTVVPPSIGSSKFLDRYNEAATGMIRLYKDLVEDGVPRSEAIGVMPHSLRMYDFIHIDGWNAIHSLGKRTCVTAQWEIRNIANEVAREIRKVSPVLGKYIGRQCKTYGYCPEEKDEWRQDFNKSPCEFYSAHKGKFSK